MTQVFNIHFAGRRNDISIERNSQLLSFGTKLLLNHSRHQTLPSCVHIADEFYVSLTAFPLDTRPEITSVMEEMRFVLAVCLSARYGNMQQRRKTQ